MKRAIILPSLVTAFLALSPVGVALADNAHNGNTTGTTTGQPNQSAGPPTPPCSRRLANSPTGSPMRSRITPTRTPRGECIATTRRS